MNIPQARELIEPFLKMKELQILDLFQEDAQRKGRKFLRVRPRNEDYSSLYIPGTRKDRALLICHVDTVFNDSPKIDPQFDGIFYSGNRKRGLTKNGRPTIEGLGIGGDDRCGVALLWHYRDMGHSLLLVNSEESGCLGSTHFMADEERAKEAQLHSFAIEFDRHGRKDLVFYNVGSPEFEKYCIEQTGYETAIGSYTDLCIVCEIITGVNISVGYKNEHSANEVVSVRQFLNTLTICERWLSKPLPKFLQSNKK